jgi:hypothetical protein
MDVSVFVERSLRLTVEHPTEMSFSFGPWSPRIAATILTNSSRASLAMGSSVVIGRPLDSRRVAGAGRKLALRAIERRNGRETLYFHKTFTKLIAGMDAVASSISTD